MILEFTRKCGATHKIDTLNPPMARPTADDCAVRVFEPGYPVRLDISHDQYVACLQDPAGSIAAGLCSEVTVA